MRRIAAAAAVVAAGAVGAVAIWLVVGHDPGGPGPFDDHGGCCAVGVVAKPGQTVVEEYPLPKSLSVPVELVGVRPLRPTDARGMTFRYGARANGGGTSGRVGWKLRAWHARPLAGFVIPGYHRGILELGVSSKQLGMHHIRGFIVDYRIGGTTYSAPQHFGIDFRVKPGGLGVGAKR